eukprot:2935211-Pyramimonas_sp.AAC.1
MSMPGSHQNIGSLTRGTVSAPLSHPLHIHPPSIHLDPFFIPPPLHRPHPSPEGASPTGLAVAPRGSFLRAGCGTAP